MIGGRLLLVHSKLQHSYSGLAVRNGLCHNSAGRDKVFKNSFTKAWTLQLLLIMDFARILIYPAPLRGKFPLLMSDFTCVIWQLNQSTKLMRLLRYFLSSTEEDVMISQLLRYLKSRMSFLWPQTTTGAKTKWRAVGLKTAQIMDPELQDILLNEMEKFPRRIVDLDVQVPIFPVQGCQKSCPCKLSDGLMIPTPSGISQIFARFSSECCLLGADITFPDFKQWGNKVSPPGKQGWDY